MGPLFLVSMATVGFEIALTRYFAVAKWSEYGYWVISLVLAGFAFSGVAMAMARDAFARHGQWLLRWLPVALIVAATIGYRFVTTNPFNPLQLQNQATLVPQLINISYYYVALLPFFFLSGLYISLSFVLNYQAVGRVYGFDLTGAGAGSLLALGLMHVVHPFLLLPCLLLPLALAVLVHPRLPTVLATAAVLLGGEYLLLADNQADFNDYKAIYAPLHVPDSKVAATLYSPRGLYMLLDDFTERVDTDVSNNAGLLGVGNPPSSFGLYRDGNRLAAMPKPEPLRADYAKATLAALPYMLRPHPTVLLAGTSGGYRIAEARALGAGEILALEQEPVLLDALRNGFGSSPPFPSPPRILADSPIAAARSGATWDIIDLAGDFLDTAEANSSAVAAEAIASYIGALQPGGIVSLPVSIREFPAYAIRMLATVRAALLSRGVADPGSHVIVIRSAWNVRVLVSNRAFTDAEIAVAKAFCETRSFDISWFPGIDVEAARSNIFNDLPAVSFSSGSVTSGAGAHDAIADEAGPMLQGRATESGRDFDLSPVTYDRPAFYAVLRLSQLGILLQRLELLPQQEIGPLVNLAVLAQAFVVAAIVLIVPLFGRAHMRGRGARAGSGTIFRAIVYFSALGLGFLFLEIFLIERATFYLNDRTAAFSLVLTGMLIFSGFGSMLESRFARIAWRGLAGAIAIVLVWGIVLFIGLQDFMLATLGLPWLARAAIVVVLVAPASIALGLPFPLGLSRLGNSAFLPWAWALNGAFSVVSTPLANLMALQLGYDMVLVTALLLYVCCVFVLPHTKET
ncbi:MAG: hypothetical protein NT133_16325 [Alphaproteobacteria bacterium]|nr:hypothetical protein [Alphaproteobacteria bacterium]